MKVEALDQLLKDGVSLSSVPGTTFEYSNLGYTLLGRIIEAASGISYQKYITENIFKPLGMKDTTYEFSDVPRSKLANGYRYEDGMWKAEEMLHDGSWGAMVLINYWCVDFPVYIILLL